MSSTPVKRVLLVVLSLVFSLLQALPAAVPAAQAAGSPDVAFAATVAAETLQGASTSVTLSATNATGPDGFNLSYRVVLPVGVTFAGGSFTPLVLTDVPVAGQTTLFFENISDLPTGGSADLSFTVAHSTATYSVGSTFTIDADAYVNSDERIVPDIDSSTGAVTDVTGFDSASGSTSIVPFQLTKNEPSPEAELLRGLHSQQTVYTISVEAAPSAGTSALVIDDWIPAGIEFLGCGGGDNSTVGDEYPGSGAITVPAVSGCSLPSHVETVDSGLPAGLAPGVYTHVQWSNADLGGASIGAGTTFTLTYAAAIPMFANTMTWDVAGVPPTTGEQARNIDNNNGSSTAETTAEQAFTNYALASGTYAGDGNAYTDSGTHTVTSEDVALQKTVDRTSSAIGVISNWTLTVRTSEYAAGTNSILLTDTVPDGLCPGGTAGCAAPGPSSSYSSATENASGTWSVEWSAGSLPANGTTSITYSTEQLAWYQENGADDRPVLAGDRWSNDAELQANVGSQAVLDESSQSQSTVLTSIAKDVAVPSAAPVSCGDGSSLTWDANSAGLYGPGDRVCWRIQLDTPSIFGGDQKLSDYLPGGFSFESWSLGVDNTVPPGSVNFDGSGAAAGVLVWTFDPTTRITPPNSVFEAVISSIAGDPNDFVSGDIVGNLLKHSGLNSTGELYFDRDMATIEWGEPLVNSIVKTATATEIQAEDVVDFTIDVTNNGNEQALNVGVWDVLPRGLECPTVSGISGSGGCDAGPNPDRIEWVIPSIAAGATSSVTYSVTIPSTVAPREIYTNRTGVRRYESAINTGISDVFQYVPVDNIDPTLEPTANTEPALDSWTLETRNVVVNKNRTTSLTRLGNNTNNQATIGETVFFTIDVTVPEGTTSYGSPALTDVIDSRFFYLGDATACAGPASTPCDPSSDPLVPWTLDVTGQTITVASPGDFTVAPGAGDYLIRIAFSTTVADDGSNVRNGLIRNRATFRWQTSSGSNRSRSNTADVRLAEPNLTIAKTSNDADNIVEAGQVLTYTIAVEHNNSVPRVTSAFEVVISDTLPAGLSCAEVSNISGGGVCNAPNTIEWNASTDSDLAELQRGDTFVATFDTTLPSPIVADTTYTNTATVGGSSLPNATPGERDPSSPFGGLGSGYFASATDTVTAPRSMIAKSVDPGIQTVGEIVQYTVLVTIPGNVVQYDSTVIDMLPSGIATASSGYTVSTSCEMSGVPCATVNPIFDIVPIELVPNGGNVGWFLGDQLAVPGVPRVVTIVYDAIVEDLTGVVDGVTLTNQANVYGNRTDKLVGEPPLVPDPINFDVAGIPAEADVVVREPNLTITKLVVDGSTPVDSRRATANEDLVYRLTIENTGNWSAYNVDITDTISTFGGDAMLAVDVSDGSANGVAYVVVDGDPSNGDLAWTADGPIPAGTSFVIEYTLRVWNADVSDEDPSGPEITNTASLDEYWAVASPDASIHRRYVGGTDAVDVELDLASVGDYVWFDVNGDGVQDAGEPPIPGVEVTVVYLGSNNTPGGGDDETHIVVTDGAGAYLVDGLPGGEYSVTVTGGVPAGMTPSFDLDDGVVSPNGGWLGSLPEAAVKRDVDFGYIGTGSIGDLVWFNRNGNSVQELDEPGLGSVVGTVTFYGFDGTPGGGDDVVYPVATAPDGSYLVASLPAGSYSVAIDATTVPGGMTPNFDPDGTLDNAHAVSLGAAVDYLVADFGYAGDSSIGDLVWLDENRDGTADAGEPGITNVDVELVWPGIDGISGTADDVTFLTTTDGSGNYLFVGLNPGDYPVTILTATLPPGLDNTYDEDGNANNATTVSLPISTDHLTADFGYGGSARIGDFLWWDLNADGVQDVGEPGIPDVDVTVVWAGPDGSIGTSDDITYPRLTSLAGAYLVQNLPEGLFRVSVSGPLTTTADNTYNLDGGADNSSDVTLTTTETRLDLDFGYAGTAVLGDFVWYDINGDGVQDAGEPGLGGVTITATFFGLDGVVGGRDDVVRTTITAPDGSYVFENLPGGTYRVDIDALTLPGGMTATFDRDGTADGSTEVVLTNGDSVLDVDFGYIGTGLIGDTIWWDIDRDGTRGVSEPGWPSVAATITWFGVDGTIGTTDDAILGATTDADGQYLVSGLPAGSFRVDVDTSTLPTDLTPTSDPDGGTPDQSELTLGAGESNLGQDFGYAGTGSIGDFVWLDVNRDTIQDALEPGTAAVALSVVWLGSDGAVGGGDDLTIPTSTDSNGVYGVGGLVGGSYEIRLDTSSLPGGYVPNSDVDGGSPTTSSVTLSSGESRQDVDFGLVGDSTIAGTVWHDKNADGIIDPGEPGISGAAVTVTWRGPLGDIDLLVTTDLTGAWSLPSVPSGDYTVTLDNTTVPAGFINTTPDTVDLLVPVGGSNIVDFGVVGGVEVGQWVWVDENGNGIIDNAEKGIQGVLVEFIRNGVVTAAIATDSTGRYAFVDQFPGEFTIRIDGTTIPSDLKQTFSKDGVLDLQTTGTVGELQAVLDVNFGFQQTTLPTTGADIDIFGAAGMVLVILGALLLFGFNRREEDF